MASRSSGIAASLPARTARTIFSISASTPSQLQRCSLSQTICPRTNGIVLVDAQRVLERDERFFVAAEGSAGLRPACRTPRHCPAAARERGGSTSGPRRAAGTSCRAWRSRTRRPPDRDRARAPCRSRSRPRGGAEAASTLPRSHQAAALPGCRAISLSLVASASACLPCRSLRLAEVEERRRRCPAPAPGPAGNPLPLRRSA